MTSFVFIIVNPQFGQLETRGSVTGKRYIIGRNGAWVDSRDAPEILTLEKHQCCEKPTVKAFLRGRPSKTDMKRRPESKPLAPAVKPKKAAPPRRRRKSKATPTDKSTSEVKVALSLESPEE